MRFFFAARSMPARAARRLQRLLATHGEEHALTACQTAVALAAGYSDWRELVRVTETPNEPSPLDGEAGEAIALLRGEWQTAALARSLGLGGNMAREIAVGLGLTASRAAPSIEDDPAPPQPAPERPPAAPAVALPEEDAYGIGLDDLALDGPGVPVPPVQEVDVWVMEWLETERGWGVRPDGHSVHRSPEECKAWIDAYWARMPPVAPEEYERPIWDDPVRCRTRTDSAVWRAVLAGDNRIYRHEAASPEVKEILGAAFEARRGMRR